MTSARMDDIVIFAESAIFSVEAHGCDGLVRGSGFAIGGRLLTSGHVVVGATTMVVAGPAPAVTATVPPGGRSDGLDVAFGQMGTVGVTDADGVWDGLETARRSPGVGDPVVVLARTGGAYRWLPATVVVRAPGASYGVAGEVLLLDRAVGPGWSGGPVLDRDGRVVGLVRGVETATGLTVVVGMAAIEEWMNSDVWIDDSSSCDT